MTFYRIVIWTKKRRTPYSGIRQLDDYNIDAVHISMLKKAQETYKQDLIEVEVQMISKTCTAVMNYFEALRKRRDAKKNPDGLEMPKPKNNGREEFRPWYED